MTPPRTDLSLLMLLKHRPGRHSNPSGAGVFFSSRARHLNRERVPAAAAKTGGDQSTALLVSLQRVEERGEKTRACGAERMPKSDGASMWIQNGLGKAL